MLADSILALEQAKVEFDNTKGACASIIPLILDAQRMILQTTFMLEICSRTIEEADVSAFDKGRAAQTIANLENSSLALLATQLGNIMERLGVDVTNIANAKEITDELIAQLAGDA